MVITFSGLAFGSLLLNFDSPKNYEPFILVSLLLSVALVPILLTKRKPPKFKKTSEMKIKELFKISPLASFGMFCTGMIQSSLVTLGAVYATTMNFTILEVSIFIFLITISGAVLQWPIGFLSDLFDRRLVIIVCTFMASAFAIASILAVGTRPEAMYLGINWQSDKIIFYILVGIFAGFSLPLFSLNLAYINDFLQQEKFVAAGAGLNIIFGIGGILGPILCSVVMLKLGANGFFMYMSIIHLIIGVFGIFRVTRRKVKENPDNTYTPLPRNITPAGIALDPDTGVNLSNAEKN
jgi:MFS family permease